MQQTNVISMIFNIKQKKNRAKERDVLEATINSRASEDTFSFFAFTMAFTLYKSRESHEAQRYSVRDIVHVGKG